ncbi:hypothetical protein FACS189440_08660 [Bacteroidia bacterium]|nr:hypothetical protein FACS189423_11820 [Bacteroidia bacterium]GHT47619.1 hypothetical protein FACS189440_08660 [Bacteroidia bacterium]
MAEGVRLKNKESIIDSFIAQSKINPISKPVAHISLDFSVQDKGRLTNSVMLMIAAEYMKKMGYNNTQFIIARHNDTDHPHIHLVINRIDNDGKRISDKNEKLRSTKICMELTKKYGLYIAKGKENVKEHRLKEPDKTKYEIYHALQSAVARSTDWAELIRELKKTDISTQFKYKSGTSEVQGVKFAKNDYEFSGSKIDRQFSFSKIDYQLNHNTRTQDVQIRQEQSNNQNHASVLEMASSVLGSFLDFQLSGAEYDSEEVEFQRQKRLKKKQKRGFKL